MAKKQTRRSISVSGAMYDRLSAYCEINGIPRSRVTEKVILEALDAEDRKKAEALKAVRLENIASVVEKKEAG